MNAEYPCTRVAPAARRSRTSAAVSTPPTEITHSEAGVCCRMTRSTASARAASGAPESPPAPSWATSAAGGCKPPPGKGRVRRNDAVKSQLHNKLADPHDLVIGHIRGNFHEQWCGADNVPDASQKRRERIEFL